MSRTLCNQLIIQTLGAGENIKLDQHFIDPIVPEELACSLLYQRESQPNSTDPKNSYLILDVRSFIQYEKCHLITAINLCIPSTLLRRPTFTLGKIPDTVKDITQKNAILQWRLYKGVVFIDPSSEKLTAQSPSVYLYGKFQTEVSVTPIYWLKGGMQNFMKIYPDLCVLQEGGNTNSLNTTFSNCENKPLSTIPTVSSPKELVTDASLPSIKLQCFNDLLPAFFKNLCESKNMDKYLYAMFQDLEKNESDLLRSIMFANVPGPVTVRAGIEATLKNRYNDIWPYDFNRIILKNTYSGEDSYINASFIQSPFKYGNNFIASQAPLPGTMADFWTMVWQQNISVIIAVTDDDELGVIKYHKYWPSQEDSPLIFGDYTIHFSVSSKCNDHVESTLEVVTNNMKKKVTHLQLTTWPDRGIPNRVEEIVSLIGRVNQIQNQIPGGEKPPVLVHCSAGCGRTGTYCTLDILLTFIQKNMEEWLQTENDIIYQTICSLRQQRRGMVKTMEQFVFCYQAILYCTENWSSIQVMFGL